MADIGRITCNPLVNRIKKKKKSADNHPQPNSGFVEFNKLFTDAVRYHVFAMIDDDLSGLFFCIFSFRYRYRD